MEERIATATQKYIRISPLKMNQVMKELRGKSVEEATKILTFTNKRASRVIEKLLKSALSNAVNNHEMDADRLYIAEIFSNSGPILKRVLPAPQGRAYRINKRTCHNTIILKEKEAVEAPKSVNEEETAKPAARTRKAKTAKTAETAGKKTAKKKEEEN